MKISVIVPIYNSELYLKRCINSLLNQTYNDFEIILINDGSTDKSLEICEKFEFENSNIKVINKKNGGSASARNLGLSIASGEYLIFVDSDDYVKENYLEKLINLAIKNNADLVQCSFEIIKKEERKNYTLDKTNSNKIEIYNNIEMLERLCSKKTYLCSIVLWNKLIRKSIFENISFIENKSVDDEYIIPQILYKSKKNVVIDTKLYYYFMSDNSQMRSNFSLKKLDIIDAVEYQQFYFLNVINNKKLYNMNLYRYYSSIMYGYYMVKKYYKQEYEIIENLKNKRKDFYKALLVKEISYRDKFLLLINRYFPSIFNFFRFKKNMKIFGK